MPRRLPGLSSSSWACARAGTGVDASGTRPPGLAAGDTRHHMLGASQARGRDAGRRGHGVALADLIDFEHGAYMLDTAAIRHLVDPATTADPGYIPSTTRREARTLDTHARYARWRRPPTAR